MQSPSDSITNLIQQFVIPSDSLDSLIKNAVESVIKKETIEVLPFLVQILDSLIWPLVMLVILWAFKNNFVKIFEQIQSIKAGPGGIEINLFEKKIKEANSLANIVTATAGISKSFAPPPDPDPFGPSDPKLKVTKMHLDLDRKLKEKAAAGGLTIPKEINTKNLSAKLKTANLLSDDEFQLVNVLTELVNGVHSGVAISNDQADEILNIYNKLP